MKRLIVTGDPGIRKEGIIEHDGEEKVLFQVTRNGDWHGPAEVQLWCIIGTEDEREAFEKQEFIPHWLDVERVDAAEIDIVKAAGDMAV